MQYPVDFDFCPEGFSALESEPEFRACSHLALERADQVFRLSDFGYSPKEVSECPSDFAISSVFRILSDEGAACLYEVCKQLEPFASSNSRIERCVRGGVYRSRFLRDLCLSPDVCEFVSELCEAKLLPHTIPHQLGHINFAPKKSGGNVDKWHVDTLRYDYVLFVTDPNKNQGGAFQYFRGTKHEMAKLKQQGAPLPPDKVASAAVPGAGYAVMQQGNMVVHQAKGLDAPGERITMVNGYILQDAFFPDYTRYDQLALADPPHVAAAEYARHAALRGQRMLSQDIANAGFDSSRNSHADRLSAAAKVLQDAAEQIRAEDKTEMEHFGD